MYRDDKDAADAVAAGLKRDNAELERENAELKRVLAARPASAPPPAPTKSKKQREREKKQRKAERKRQHAKVRNAVYNWSVRVACGLAVGVASFMITRSVYPALHPGKTGLFASGLAAVVNQLWGQVLIAQPLLGWWPNEDDDSGYDVLSLRQRVLAVAGGVCAVVVFAVFFALVGESSPGP